MNTQQTIQSYWLANLLLNKSKLIIHCDCEILCKEINKRNKYIIVHIVAGLSEDTISAMIENNETIPKTTSLYEAYRITAKGKVTKTERSNKKCS